MIATILEAIKDLLADIPIIEGILKKYFPAKTEEQKQEESQAQVDSRIQKEEDGQRPTWGK